MSAELVAVAALAIWLYLLVGRGFFWRGSERDDTLAADGGPRRGAWPSVTAIVPARDEADVIRSSIGSLLAQTYPGRFTVVLVDDQSTDGTADAARKAAGEARGSGRLTVLAGSEPPGGWTGKLWALDCGFRYVEEMSEPPDYVLFTDADIAYRAPDAVRRLVEGADARGTVLTSLMVKLRCESFAERLLIPAFIFFFAMLYPFAWANDPRRKLAAAAGGCMLVRRTALTDAGGLQAIKGALIDDCALAALLKRQGPIWLGLTERVASLRPYPTVDAIRRMVSRSAYAELRYSPLRLFGTLVGMALTYLAPPLLALFGDGVPRLLGLIAWAAMALAFLPTLRLYGRSPLWGLALPRDRGLLHRLHSRLRHPALARARRRVEGKIPGSRDLRRKDRRMITATEARSGKTHRDENFPVASRLIQPRHRGPILAFYRFVRAADDIADHPRLEPQEKLDLLDKLDDALDRARAIRPGSRAAQGRACRARLEPAPRARSPRRLPHGCEEAALRRLARPHALLQPVGDAGRALRARRPRREAADDVARLRRDLRRAPGHQSPAGLRRRLPQSRSRLPAPRHALAARRSRRGLDRGRMRAPA